MSTDDLREIYQFREALEVQLVRLVVQRATPADIADLEDLLNTNEMGPEELDSSVATGSRFHRALARIAGNRRIADTLLNLENATLRARVLGTVRVRETREEHAALVEAIRLHNMQQAEELMRDHLEQAFEYLTGPYAVGAPVVRDTV
jgi:DNA-binding GntR family transcriptional regulator